MQSIDPEQWNALARGAGPFLKHEFLLALESSGSVCPATGWTPCHVQVSDDQRLVAAMPMYLKDHSYGEYVFDWSWADAYQRYGQRYYPKLLTAVPFTPSQAPRILMAGDAQRRELINLIVDAVKRHGQKNGISSWHVLFPLADCASALTDQGLIRREGCQFHWRNRGYQGFDDFLQTFSSRKRKNLRKERADVLAQGITFERLAGADISIGQWQRFYRFYENTYLVRGQQAYLTPEFFEQVASTMPENIMMVMAKHQGIDVAGALFFQDENTLFGRYWGCAADYQNLHFETCYYQGIEYCIENALQRFDAGAQGEHKLRRGFEPVTTLSCHWIKDPAFADAISNFCRDEAEHIHRYQQVATEHLPFRQE